MHQPIAVVTGGNRSLGFEICRQLARREIHVILTARNVESGSVAVKTLQREGLSVIFHTLDVRDVRQIQTLVNYLSAEYGRADILVNNAGIYLDQHQPALSIAPEQIIHAVQTDVYGTFAMCQAFIPLMKVHRYGRIVNLSSRTSRLNQMNHLGLTYKIAKSSINIITIVLAQDIARDNEGSDILINAVNPGWLATDMGGEQAEKSPIAGAEGPVMLATLPAGGISGAFFNGTQLQPW